VRFALRYLAVYSAFGLVLGTVYYVLTQEWVGSIALWFLGLMPAIVGVWWVRHGPSDDVRRADDPDADPGAAAGASIGSFPMASAWPAFLVLGAIVTGAALIYGLILLPVGASMLAWAVFGLARESRG
jgi:hypothetical protein